MEIIRERKAKKLCSYQKSYIKKVVERFEIHNILVSAPFATRFNLFGKMLSQTKGDSQKREVSHKNFLSTKYFLVRVFLR